MNERKARFNDMAKRLAEMEDGSREEELSLWGGVQGSFTQQTDLSNSPNYKEILSILHASPMLVAPALKFLQIKRAAMAKAQLEVLYSPEELQEMMKEAHSK